MGVKSDLEGGEQNAYGKNNAGLGEDLGTMLKFKWAGMGQVKTTSSRGGTGKTNS